MQNKTYISLLRGINVSGHNKIKMDDLKKLYSNLGFINVQSYIQSGNLIFRFKESDKDNLELIISSAIFDKFAIKAPVLILDYFDLKEAIDNNPFILERNEDISKLHITIMSELGDDLIIESIDRTKYMPDEFVFNKNYIYLLCPNSYGNTKLNNNFFENKLKLRATTRNWKSITKLKEIADSLQKIEKFKY